MLAKHTAPFEAAHEQLKAADKRLRARLRGLHEANEKLLAVKLELEATKKRASEFAASGSFDVAEGALIVQKQAQASGLDALLEQSVEALSAGVAADTADVLIAERECVATQLAYHEKVFGDAIAEFLRAHRAELLNLTTQARLVERFRDGPIVAIPSIVDVMRAVTHAAAQILASSEEFQAAAKTKETTIDAVHRSDAIDASTRTALGPNVANGREYLIRLLLPKPVAAAEPFDVANAVQRAREAAQSAEDCRARLEAAEQSQRIHPGDPNVAKTIENLKAEIDRCDAIVEVWDQRITEFRASQEA